MIVPLSPQNEPGRMNAPSPATTSSWVSVFDRNLAGMAVGAALLVFVADVVPFLRHFPYSDEWSYLAPLTSSQGLSLGWLFAQSNDHRIPIQKLMDVLWLRLAGGDFRWIVILNVAAAVLATVAWLDIARMVRRGRRAFGDAIIPLLFLSCGFNSVVWGFSFQFVASTVFLSLAAWAWAAHTSGRLKQGRGLAFIALAFCAWTGANGIIASAVLGSFLVLSAISEPKRPELPRGVTWAFPIIWATSSVIAIAAWAPSSTTTASVAAPIGAVLGFAFGMTGSWMGIYADASGAIGPLVAAIALGGAVAFSSAAALRAKRQRDDSFEHQWMLLGSVACAIATVIAVAVSRGGVEAWTPGLAFHYGYLTLLIPIVAWVAVSRAMRPRVLPVASLAAIVVMTYVYAFDLRWRIESLHAEYPAIVAADQALRSGDSAQVVAATHISEFNYLDTPGVRVSITGNIGLLRELPYWANR